MSAAIAARLRGRKGGSSKPKQPKETPDNLRSTATAKILIAVGEGEFDEIPTGQDIYLDNTPIANSNGGINFPGVTWEWRPGSVEQDYIPGIPAVENETTLNVELRNDVPWVRTLSNTQLSAVRIRFAWPALQKQESSGDVVGYRIEYRVEVSTDGGAFVEALREAVDGKTTTRYERSRRIDLPKASSGWTLRVVRITPNQNTNRIADNMVIAGFTEVVDAKLRYPNTALLYVEFSAEQLPNIPAVTVECRARRVSVPSNYDPASRFYSGIWDGTFKSAWTDNPVWHTFDVVTNDRFGVGRRIKPWMVDRWEMYRIAQYCDQLVPDGKGGQEPRFTCNLNLQSRAEAWKLLHDLSAIYRGMTYWAQGQLKVQADIPRATDFDFAFTRANVIDGRFTYSSSSERNRYSRALVSYDNPLNNYETDVAVATDKRLQLRYGDNPVEIGPVGCTRESQAQRHGKWAVLTNSQDRVVTFRVGLDGRIPLPGYVVPVADSLLAGREVGGRVSAVAGRTITLDRDTMAKAGDRLILNLPSGKCEGRTVVSVNARTIVVSTSYSEPPAPELVWALDADELAIPLYRVMKTTQPEPGIFEITALQYEPTKFAAVDTGAKLETRPISVIPTGAVEPPEHVGLSTFNSVDQGIAVSTMTIFWSAVSGAVAYEVEWKRNDGNWVRLPRTGAPSVDVRGIYAGQYLARVRSISAFEITSSWRTSLLTELQGKTTPPPAPAFLAASPLVFGIGLKWGFPAEGAADTAFTEIQYGPAQDEQAAMSLGLFAYPTTTHTMTGLAAGVRFFFRARLIDRTGNVGPWFGWIMGQSSDDADVILDYLVGKITESQLGQDLIDQIGQIDDLSEQVQVMEAQLAEVVGAVEWSATDTYLEGSIVKDGGALYRAVMDVPANTSTSNTTYWEKIGDYASLGEAVAALAARMSSAETMLDDVTGELVAQANELSALQTEIDGKASSSAVSSLTTRVTETENEVSALVTSTQKLSATVMPDGAGDTDWGAGDLVVHAGSITIQSISADSDLAQAKRSDLLEAQVGNNAAEIARVDLARAEGDAALASSVQTLTASVDSASASVQQVSQAQASLENGLSAMWSVKLQIGSGGQYEFAGIGLGIENVGGVLQSQFLVRANRFAILNDTGSGLVSPFVVQGGQTIISNAVIGDASINFAKISDTIQSTNYVAGVSGWRLQKNGNFEINGSVPGQGRILLNNNGLKVYDNAGTVRVKVGNLLA
ncbi:phage tail protein [Pseudomonas sp. TTU2014-080ASC]|uniref:phage tail protein n=1 Tax=Pseudomonas sp. TTU2014-080ASC TaxID=1729724 RepID=UPI000718993E|nr:DUF1983 domain-containing protein [Pseudomonas sp. TTU2014-080ASC]KRW62326.1 hypothetical protein AO726_02575 [Pseudomonas sp. TTU2014-080ASC]